MASDVTSRHMRGIAVLAIARRDRSLPRVIQDCVLPGCCRAPPGPPLDVRGAVGGSSWRPPAHAVRGCAAAPPGQLRHKDDGDDGIEPPRTTRRGVAAYDTV